MQQGNTGTIKKSGKYERMDKIIRSQGSAEENTASGSVFQGGALWLVSVTCKDRLQYCRQKSCYSCKDSNLSIGKSTGKKKKTENS